MTEPLCGQPNCKDQTGDWLPHTLCGLRCTGTHGACPAGAWATDIWGESSVCATCSEALGKAYEASIGFTTITYINSYADEPF
jgi:hypothetical protein